MDDDPLKFIEQRICSLSHHFLRRHCNIASSLHERKFQVLFGVTPKVAGQVWLRLHSKLLLSVRPKHILWGILFLKNTLLSMLIAQS